jgi:hypothetical protein
MGQGTDQLTAPWRSMIDDFVKSKLGSDGRSPCSSSTAAG